jgi:alanyl-tRNA synthetase
MAGWRMNIPDKAKQAFEKFAAMLSIGPEFHRPSDEVERTLNQEGENFQKKLSSGDDGLLEQSFFDYVDDLRIIRKRRT